MTRAERIRQIVDVFKQSIYARNYIEALHILKTFTRERWNSNDLLFAISKVLLIHLKNVPDEWRCLSEITAIIQLMCENAGDNHGIIGTAAYFYTWYAHDFVEAYSLYERLFACASTKLEWGSCYSAAVICDQLQMYDKMAIWLQRAESLAHDDLDRNNLKNLCAVHLMNTGNPREAIAILRNIVNASVVTAVAHTNLTRAYLIAGELKDALHYANIALQQDRSIVNLINIASIMYRQKNYDAAIDYASEIVDRLDVACCESFDPLEIERKKQLQKSKQASFAATEAFKCLIKACLKLNRKEVATIYLHRAKSMLPNNAIWRDIEDMWPNDSAKIDEVVSEHYVALLSQYPRIPDKAAWCIARAETISEFLSDPALWYDAVCRDHGMAFEIILRHVVCKNAKTMSLQELIDYISSMPGDPLYGGNELLHRLRRIRNNVSHEPVASAEDVERSRHILFEEVLAKL